MFQHIISFLLVYRYIETLKYLSHADLAVLALVGIALEVYGKDVPLERGRAVLLVVAEDASVRSIGFEDDEVAHRGRPVVDALAVDRFLYLSLSLEQLQRL